MALSTSPRADYTAHTRPDNIPPVFATFSLSPRVYLAFWEQNVDFHILVSFTHGVKTFLLTGPFLGIYAIPHVAVVCVHYTGFIGIHLSPGTRSLLAAAEFVYQFFCRTS